MIFFQDLKVPIFYIYSRMIYKTQRLLSFYCDDFI